MRFSGGEFVSRGLFLRKPASHGIVDSHFQRKTVKQHVRPTPSRPHYVLDIYDYKHITEGFLAGFPGPINSRNAAVLHLAHECIRSVEDRLFGADSNLQLVVRTCLEKAVASNFTEETRRRGEPAHGLSLQTLIGIRDLAFFRYRAEIYDVDGDDSDGEISSDDEEPMISGYSRVPDLKTLGFMFERHVKQFNLKVGYEEAQTWYANPLQLICLYCAV